MYRSGRWFPAYRNAAPGRYCHTVEKEEKDFEDYELGIMSMDFAEKVEIVEAYLPQSQLQPLEKAIEELTVEQETAGIYVVQAGDTLSEISLKVNIPMEQIVAMNDALETLVPRSTILGTASMSTSSFSISRSVRVSFK